MLRIFDIELKKFCPGPRENGASVRAVAKRQIEYFELECYRHFPYENSKCHLSVTAKIASFQQSVDRHGSPSSPPSPSSAIWCDCIDGCAHLRRPHIVVVPSSVLDNWDSEFEKFCPALEVVKYHGSQNNRATMRRRLNRVASGADRQSMPVG